MDDAVIMNKIWKRVILFAESNKSITTAHHSGAPSVVMEISLMKGSLVLLAKFMNAWNVFSPRVCPLRGNMQSSSSFAVMFSNNILMKTHNCAISTESVDSSN